MTYRISIRHSPNTLLRLHKNNSSANKQMRKQGMNRIRALRVPGPQHTVRLGSGCAEELTVPGCRLPDSCCDGAASRISSGSGRLRSVSPEAWDGSSPDCAQQRGPVSFGIAANPRAGSGTGCGPSYVGQADGQHLTSQLAAWVSSLTNAAQYRLLSDDCNILLGVI